MRKNLNIFIILVSLTFFSAGSLLAATYYVDATIGNDDNNGLSTGSAWKTIHKVNNITFQPGDTIKFKAGEVWREQLDVPSSGSSLNPITFTKYGTGNNPLIRTTERFDSWSHEGGGLYSGQLPDKSILNYFGAADQTGQRVPRYWYYKIEGSAYNPPADPHDISDGFFYSPYNNRRFYFKSVSAPPGALEIGARKYCIGTNQKNYITIDGIDCSGPNGAGLNEDGRSSKGIYVYNSNNVIIRNLSVRHISGKALSFVKRDTADSFTTNVTIDDCGTGVYYQACSDTHTLANSTITNIGNVIPDTGDRDFVGVLSTDFVTIENNYMERRIWENDDQRADQCGITFADGGNGDGSTDGIVRYNYITDPGECGIYVGTGNNFIVNHNVIDGWGLRPITWPWHKFNGIHIGAGITEWRDTTPQNVKIYNNLLINGHYNSGNYAAIFVGYNNTSGLEIKNNIITNNDVAYSIYYNPINNTDLEIKNNIFYNTTANPSVAHYGKSALFNNDGIHLSSDQTYNGFRNYLTGNYFQNPELTIVNGKYSLKKGSPAIDKGLPTGIVTDFYGNAIPAGDGPDIGPFEYISPFSKTVLLLPPQGFKVMAQ